VTEWPIVEVIPLEVVLVNEWREFAEIVNSRVGEVNAERFVFRGQPSSTYQLESSFDRRFQHLNPMQRVRIGKRIETLFRATAERAELSIPDDDAEMICMGQHFGLATRMLDWSDSRYVAAFFAFSALTGRYESSLDAERRENNERVSVFALDVSSGLWSEDSVQILRVANVGQNDRLRRQRGLFTVNHTQFTSIESFMDDYLTRNPGEIDRTPVYRFDIGVGHARKALRDMQEMRISHAELFPGVEGVARETMLGEWLNDS
jgi:hypothetical protein